MSTRLAPIDAHAKVVLRRIVELGGEADPEVLKAEIEQAGYTLFSLRIRGLIEPWMDVARINDAGCAYLDRGEHATGWLV